jgi:hypothetical protein
LSRPEGVGSKRKFGGLVNGDKEQPMMKFLRRLFCRHTHGRMVAIEWDGTAVYECAACGKRIEKRL